MQCKKLYASNKTFWYWLQVSKDNKNLSNKKLVIQRLKIDDDVEHRGLNFRILIVASGS